MEDKLLMLTSYLLFVQDTTNTGQKLRAVSHHRQTTLCSCGVLET